MWSDPDTPPPPPRRPPAGSAVVVVSTSLWITGESAGEVFGGPHFEWSPFRVVTLRGGERGWWLVATKLNGDPQINHKKVVLSKLIARKLICPKNQVLNDKNGSPKVTPENQLIPPLLGHLRYANTQTYCLVFHDGGQFEAGPLLGGDGLGDPV